MIRSVVSKKLTIGIKLSAINTLLEYITELEYKNEST